MDRATACAAQVRTPVKVFRARNRASVHPLVVTQGVNIDHHILGAAPDLCLEGFAALHSIRSPGDCDYSGVHRI